MEMKAARRLGGGISVQTLLYVIAFLEVFGLIEETRGDFANGILFFLYEQLNPFELDCCASYCHNDGRHVRDTYPLRIQFYQYHWLNSAGAGVWPSWIRNLSTVYLRPHFIVDYRLRQILSGRDPV